MMTATDVGTADGRGHAAGGGDGEGDDADDGGKTKWSTLLISSTPPATGMPTGRCSPPA